MNIIPDKAAMYRLYERGAFGNKLRSWASLEEYKAANFTAKVGLRYAGKHGGGFVAYDLTPDQVDGVVSSWLAKGATRSLIRPAEAAPDQRLILQGEVMRTIDGLYLRYSRVKSQMRIALAKESLHAYRAEALAILTASLTPGSFADLEALLDTYHDAVIEFSAYTGTLGNVRGRNAILWEVRNY